MAVGIGSVGEGLGRYVGDARGSPCERGGRTGRRVSTTGVWAVCRTGLGCYDGCVVGVGQGWVLGFKACF